MTPFKSCFLGFSGGHESPWSYPLYFYSLVPSELINFSPETKGSCQWVLPALPGHARILMKAKSLSLIYIFLFAGALSISCTLKLAENFSPWV